MPDYRKVGQKLDNDAGQRAITTGAAASAGGLLVFFLSSACPWLCLVMHYAFFLRVPVPDNHLCQIVARLVKT